MNFRLVIFFVSLLSIFVGCTSEKEKKALELAADGITTIHFVDGYEDVPYQRGEFVKFFTLKKKTSYDLAKQEITHRGFIEEKKMFKKLNEARGKIEKALVDIESSDIRSALEGSLKVVSEDIKLRDKRLQKGQERYEILKKRFSEKKLLINELSKILRSRREIRSSEHKGKSPKFLENDCLSDGVKVLEFEDFPEVSVGLVKKVGNDEYLYKKWFRFDGEFEIGGGEFGRNIGQTDNWHAKVDCDKTLALFQDLRFYFTLDKYFKKPSYFGQ